MTADQMREDSFLMRDAAEFLRDHGKAEIAQKMADAAMRMLHHADGLDRIAKILVESDRVLSKDPPASKPVPRCITCLHFSMSNPPKMSKPVYSDLSPMPIGHCVKHDESMGAMWACPDWKAAP